MRSTFLFRILSLLCAFSLTLAGCALPAGPTGASGDLSAWLDQPVNGAVLPLAPFTLKAHARHASGAGVTKVVFLVNSVPAGSAETDAAEPIVYAEIDWNPSGPGLYRVEAQAFAGQASSTSEVSLVCVSAEAKLPALGYGGDCEQPASGAGGGPAPSITDTPAGVPPVELKITGTPNPVFYGACSAGETTSFTFDLYVGAPAYADVLDIHYSLQDSGGSELRSSTLTIPGNPAVDTYNPTLDMNAATSGMGGVATLMEFYAEAVDAIGSIVGTSPAQSVDVSHCAPTPTPTSKPVLAADTTPPTLDITLISANPVFYTTGCGPNTLTVEAYAVDPSGIGSVTLVYGYVGAGTEGIFRTMTSAGGGTYRVTIDVGGEAYTFLGGVDGQISITVLATDSRGNTAEENGGTVTIQYCPG